MFAKLLFLVGFLFIFQSAGLYYKSVIPAAEINLLINEDKSTIQSKTPMLLIEELNIKTPIYPAVYTKNDWKVDSRGVSQTKNIIYGHNWKSMLGDLVLAKKGMHIRISSEDGSQKTYVVEKVMETNPDKFGFIENIEEDELVIYTCSGFLDSKRFVVFSKII